MTILRPARKAFELISETRSYLKKSQKDNVDIIALKKMWADEVFSHLQIKTQLLGRASAEKPILFVGNHLSYLDIPLLMSTAENISFVAKHEISQWPIFGAAARRINTVFVKREAKNSRQSARLAITDALTSGQRIAIFPSGTTCLNEKKEWRRGVFEIARDLNVKIQPFRISYSPLRAAAYIDQDFFPAHLVNLYRQSSIEAQIEFHDPVFVKDPIQDCHRWQDWTKFCSKSST